MDVKPEKIYSEGGVRNVAFNPGILPAVEIASSSTRGYAPYNSRTLNQDSYIIETDGHTGAMLVAVFDGHGKYGHKISQYFKSVLPAAIFLDRSFPSDVFRAITRQVGVLETILVADKTVSSEFSGTTMSLCIVLGYQVYAANVGNSRSVIGESDRCGKNIAIQLTQDHLPSVEKESVRIKSKGGRIFPVYYESGLPGKQRVWLGHMDVPGLAISRSLGDTIATTVGVISNPDCTSYSINSSSRYLIVASDGVWEVMENQELIDILSYAENITNAMHTILAETYSRWMDSEQVVDDTTICIIRFA